MKNKLIIIDAGHGGIIKGVYQTPGKRGCFDNACIYEGVLNRAIAHYLNFELSIRNVNTHIINPENKDISLKSRVYRINNITRKLGTDNVFLLSIHHNAFNLKSANGFECYTSTGITDADPAAEELMNIFTEKYPNRRARWRFTERGKKHKEAKYRILNNTLCPAVLTEFSFMTNKSEFDYITKYNGIQDEVNLLVFWIMNTKIK